MLSTTCFTEIKNEEEVEEHGFCRSSERDQHVQLNANAQLVPQKNILKLYNVPTASIKPSVLVKCNTAASFT